jgi:hypothetical protein
MDFASVHFCRLYYVGWVKTIDYYVIRIFSEGEFMKKEETPIVVEQDFDRPASDVWDAITKIGEMRRRYFENILIENKLQPR